jgi:hypothetical protein
MLSAAIGVLQNSSRSLVMEFTTMKNMLQAAIVLNGRSLEDEKR